MSKKPQIFAMIAIVLSGVTLFSIFASAEEGLIPSWIRNTAGFWVDRQISDTEFINALQYLVKEGILVIPLEQNEKEEKTDVSQLTVQELKEQAVSWNYKDILRDEEYYIGKIIHLTGSITMTDIGDDGWVEYFVATNEDEWGYPDAEYFYVWYDGSRLLYEDTIEAYVMVDNIYEVKAFDWQYYPVVTAIHLTCTNC